MADIYMHQRLAQDILKAYPHLEADFLMVGSQGPDPLYYLIFSSLFKNARQVGDRLHDTAINTLFSTMTNYVKSHYDPALYSFYVGFLLHFALDTNIHPYVYHHVGQYDKDNRETHHMRGLHLRFERRIDAILIQEDTADLPHRYPLEKALPLGKIPDAIGDMMDYVIYETLGVSHGKLLYADSYLRMKKVLKYMIKDRLGIKRVFYGILDYFNRSSSLYYKDLSFRRLNFDDFDYLNRNHHPWYHPVTNVPSYKSVDDLYLDAYEDACKYIDETTLYIINDHVVDLNHLFQNRSLNSGIDADDPRAMTYLNIYTDNIT